MVCWSKAAVLALANVSLLRGAVRASCPFANVAKDGRGSMFPGAENVRHARQLQGGDGGGGDGGVPEGGYQAVTQDVMDMLTVPQDFFPPDFYFPRGHHYGGLLIRLAWHCNGSYRTSDGRGGCDGGRIRFDPELTWPDNENLDNALELLRPIKEKHGSSLSWGDLIVIAGNAAIESMGGPILGFCGGRIDDGDGSGSNMLGPSDEQEEIMPCVSIGQQGNCSGPLGQVTMGLIYVDPEGPQRVPDPVGSSVDVRDSFLRMGMNDTETVALVGGGHAFGKAHGACEDPPCGQGTTMEGIGHNTWTSGIEGAWTTDPTNWDNEFFNNLFDYNWSLEASPAGHHQWYPNDGPVIMMTTADLSLINDPEYEALSRRFADDQEYLDEQFAHAWYKLTTRDMGPITRCIGDQIAPVQEWQNPLPPPPSTLTDFVPIRARIEDFIDGDVRNAAAFVNLAYRCASTYRDTDHFGGCNGARIRFHPEAYWPSNVGTADALAALAPVKASHRDVSWADIIVLAGQTALERAGHNAMDFCGGRVDAVDGSGSENLAPRVYENATASVRDDFEVKGLTPREGVALAGRQHQGNSFFVELLAADANDTEISQEMRSSTYTDEELALVRDPEFKAIVEEYANDEQMYYAEFAAAWTKLMTADRFDGPRDNICTGVSTPTREGDRDNTQVRSSGAASLLNSAIVTSMMCVTVGSIGQRLIT